MQSYNDKRLIYSSKTKRVLKSSYMTRRIYTDRSSRNSQYQEKADANLDENHMTHIIDENALKFENLETANNQKADHKANQEKAIKSEAVEASNPQKETARQQLLKDHKRKHKGKAPIKLQTKSKMDYVLEADVAEVKMLKKKIIEEELALLKAKHKVPAKSTKRITRNKENEEVTFVKPEVKESVNMHLEELKNKNTYIERREDQKYKEEMRKKEATEFIKKLKQDK